MDALTSRKFIMACIVFAVGTLIFVFTSKLTGDQWLLLAGVSGGGYGVLNVLDTLLGKNKPPEAPKQ